MQHALEVVSIATAFFFLLDSGAESTVVIASTGIFSAIVLKMWDTIRRLMFFCCWYSTWFLEMVGRGVGQPHYGEHCRLAPSQIGVGDTRTM